MVILHRVVNLSNGIQVVTEYMDYAGSVSAGVWVFAGSFLETTQNNGVSHFVEHLLFKGTESRTAREIAHCMDAVGGQINAVTAKEYTCYYTKTLPEHLDAALELLGDMLTNSNLAQEDIDTERKVILEEISMCGDDAEDLIYDIACRAMWKDASLGFPVTGTVQRAEGLDRNEIVEYFKERYTAENIVISVAGKFDQGRVIESLEKGFGGIKRCGAADRSQKKLIHTQSIEIVNKDIEQCQLCIGFEGFPRVSPKDCQLDALNALFGGNMSSRLFQKVREEQGFAYSVYSDVASHLNNGSMCIWAGLNPENLVKVLEIINWEIKALKKHSFTETELETAKTQLKASLIMDNEGVSSRECANGKELLLDGSIEPLSRIQKRIDSVTVQDVADVIDFVFDRNRMTVALLGKTQIREEQILNILDF